MTEEVEDLKAQLAEANAKLEEADSGKEVTNLKRALTLSKKKEAELAKTINDMEDDMVIVDGVVEGTSIMVMTPDEYQEYSDKNGRYMGRKIGTKTKPSIEELRACINSKWTPQRFMDKHGMDADDLKQLVWKLSTKELRGKPIKYSIEQNYFSREG